MAVAIVTGAGSGIGAATAKALAAEFTIPWHFIPTPTGT